MATETSLASLLPWPHQAPAWAAQCLTDAHVILGMEQGPPRWWQAWQQSRLSALLQWLQPFAWWQVWAGQGARLAATGDGLTALPIMRRADYRRLIESHPPVAPAQHGPLNTYSTSGSSGVPVRFSRSQLALRINDNHYWADHLRQGRDLSATLIGITPRVGTHEGSHRLTEGEPWLWRGKQFSRLSTAFNAHEHAQWLCQHPARYLAVPGAMLAAIMSSMRDLQLIPPKLSQVLTLGNTIEPDLRQCARNTFGASIRDRYSCEELGPLAFQCPRDEGYYHCAVTNVILEVLNEQDLPVADGVQGTVVVTGLHQWASPAVRYELGDLATWHAHCPGCDATVPALSQLLGRKLHLLRSPEGVWQHVRLRAQHWLACAPVREYRVVQQAEDRFEAELVMDQPLTELQAQAIQAMLCQTIGPNYQYTLRQVSAIAWPSRHKRQEFVGMHA